MKSVCFYDSKGVHRFMGFGQMTTLFQACYFKAMELGYDNVIMEWHNMVSYLMDKHGNFTGTVNTPNKDILPITFIDKGSRLSKSVDRIDLSKEDSLYEGCPKVIANPMTMAPMFSYLNKYYLDTGIRPTFDVEKDGSKSIFFHFRRSDLDRQKFRNTPVDRWVNLVRYLKALYGEDYKFIKTGEVSPIDDEFDEIVTYLPNDIQKLFRYINDASLFVGSASGPVTIAYMFNTPVIVFVDERTKLDWTGERWNKMAMKKYGNTTYDWLDKEKVITIFGKEYDVKENINIIDKKVKEWLIDG